MSTLMSVSNVPILPQSGALIAAALGRSCYAQQVRVRCGDVAELDANVADKCNRLSTVLALCHLPIIWRGFADSPKILKKRSDSEAAQ